jgi:hypothetical protein
MIKGKPKSSILIVMGAALCHNISHIHSSLFQIAKARSIRVRLCNTVGLMLPKEQEISQVDIEFFVMTLVVDQMDDFRFAPAA